MNWFNNPAITQLVSTALREDIGSGDVTSQAVLPANGISRAWMVAREPMVVAGLPVAAMVFQRVSPRLKAKLLTREGAWVPAGTKILEVSGPSRALLTAERTALNFAQRLSGVATITRRYVEAVRGTGARILDTRKTIPGLRRLQKYAVACGGGQNHRFGLYDLVLIKDNHLAALKGAQPNPLAAAISHARRRYPKLKVEVEADTLEQVSQAVEARADIILLDNMSPARLRQAVKLVRGRAKTEASGGITLKTVRRIAETGVDYISVGALTHSAPAVDIALDHDD